MFAYFNLSGSNSTYLYYYTIIFPLFPFYSLVLPCIPLYFPLFPFGPCIPICSPDSLASEHIMSLYAAI